MTEEIMPAPVVRIETGLRFLRMLARTVLFACVIGLTGWNAHAADDAATLEQRVKAAFLFQFTGYVEWPPATFAQDGTPVTIAVMGADPLAAELSQAVTGRTVGGRSVTVRRVRAGDSLAGIHILFVGLSESARLNQLAQAARSRPILMVTESEGALAQGSMINFILVDRRVRFEVALDPVEKSGLKLSSRLLAVAQQVRTEAH